MEGGCTIAVTTAREIPKPIDLVFTGVLADLADLNYRAPRAELAREAIERVAPEWFDGPQNLLVCYFGPRLPAELVRTVLVDVGLASLLDTPKIYTATQRRKARRARIHIRKRRTNDHHLVVPDEIEMEIPDDQ